MAKEILAIPEEALREVLGILRAGLVASPGVTASVRAALEAWCSEEEAYVQRIESLRITAPGAAPAGAVA